jgi:hypothetical protein
LYVPHFPHVIYERCFGRIPQIELTTRISETTPVGDTLEESCQSDFEKPPLWGIPLKRVDNQNFKIHPKIHPVPVHPVGGYPR